MSPVSVLKPECLKDPLPRLAFLEASAGTGKTWTLERIVVDLLITHKLPIRQILLVTFTRKGAADMAERVRRCITEMLDAPRLAARGEPAWVVDADARTRLQQALAEFDQAPISTIHSFCQRVLDEQVVLAGIVRDPASPDVSALLHDAFTDHIRVVARDNNDARTFLREWRLVGQDIEDIEQLIHEASAHVVEPKSPLSHFRAHIDDALLRKSQDALFAALEKGRPTEAEVKAALPRTKNVDVVLETWDRLAAIAAAPARRGLPPRALQLHVLLAMETVIDQGRAPFVTPTPGKSHTHFLFGAMRAAYLAGPTFEALALATFFPETMATLHREAQHRGVSDDQRLLIETRDALRADASLGVLHARVRERFQAVLVDEFQDTDEVQWEILRRLFVDAPSSARVALVGDPKQAIYSFRGGDLNTYVKARAHIESAGAQARTFALKRNQRSTHAMVSAYNEILLESFQNQDPFFGHPQGGVTYDSHTAVTAAGDVGNLVDAQNKVLLPLGIVTLKEDEPSPYDLKTQLMHTFVHEAVRLVHQKHELVDAKGNRRRLMAADLMVLTNTNDDAALYVDALNAAGVRAEQYRADHLLQSEEAADIADVLDGLANPKSHAAFVKALRTLFFDVPFDELEQHSALSRDDARVRTWRTWIALADKRQWPALFSELRRGAHLARRMSLSHSGERRWLAVQAILDVLHRMARDACPDIMTLARRLRAHVEGTAPHPRDRDDEIFPASAGGQAARVLTVHKAKGLEAPVVFCALAPSKQPKHATFYTYHDAPPETRRLQWVGTLGKSAPFADAVHDETRREQRRLQYVALTRAAHRLWLPLVTRPPNKTEGKKKSVSPNDRFPASASPTFDAINLRLFSLVKEPSFSALAEHRSKPAPPIPVLPPTAPSKDLAPPTTARTDDEAQQAHARARGLQLGSYTALHKSFTVTLNPHAQKPPPSTVTDAQMPRGARAGDVMHRLLEEVPLHTVRSGQAFDAWRAHPDVTALCAVFWRHSRFTEAQRADTERMVHAALHAPVMLAEGVVLSGLGTLGEALFREVPFHMAWPTEAEPLGTQVAGRWRVEHGHIKGAIDFAFEHGGRVWFGDWKSNALLAYDDATMRASVEASYQAQVRIYTLVVCRLFGLMDKAFYAERFGGAIYVYARGVADGGGIVVTKPTWEELEELDAWLADQGKRPRSLVPPAHEVGDTPEEHEDAASRALDEDDPDDGPDTDDSTLTGDSTSDGPEEET